ncbi:MAG: sigma-70 family RNA polymerase sigma factor [bacterium]|nr:sigma-70 family RNA polymerase sigma factor [bacterium]
MPETATSPPDRGAALAPHRDALYRYLRVLGASHADAEDLQQEAFLIVLRRTEFDATSPAGVFGFLRTTARQLWLRSRRHDLSTREIDEADRIWDARCADGTGDRYLEALRDCLAQLPERSRELLRATYAEDATRQESSARFGLGLDGIKSALRRLRTRLHECIRSRLAENER